MKAKKEWNVKTLKDVNAKIGYDILKENHKNLINYDILVTLYELHAIAFFLLDKGDGKVRNRILKAIRKEQSMLENKKVYYR